MADKESTVHFMPCIIEYDGPAPVESYFSISETSGKLVSNFRGRRLVGQQVDLPPLCAGLIIEPSKKSSVTIHGTFSKMFVWDHDVIPHEEALSSSIEWLKIAHIVSFSPMDLFDKFSWIF
jgi:hypothetical protein